MIERQHGEVSLICDMCDEELGEFFADFRMMLTHAQEQGWRIVRDSGGSATHYCAACKPRTFTDDAKARRMLGITGPVPTKRRLM